MIGMFRSLGSYNYRLWAAGALVSNVGTWMQRIAQDWLVLTQLTHHNATAVGIVMALQFGPQLLLLPLSGFAADHFDRRKLLIVHAERDGRARARAGPAHASPAWCSCGTSMCSPSCSAAAPRSMRRRGRPSWPSWSAMTDLSERGRAELHLVQRRAHDRTGGGRPADRRRRHGLGCSCSTRVSLRRRAGVAVPAARARASHRNARPSARRAVCIAGFRYVWQRPDLRAMLVMLFLIGTFGLNFPIFISTMAVTRVPRRRRPVRAAVLDDGGRARCRARCSRASRERPRIDAAGCRRRGLRRSAARWPRWRRATGCSRRAGRHRRRRADLHDTPNALMQLSTEPRMRGRVMALRLGVALGGTPIGAPIVGWVADHLRPALGAGRRRGRGLCGSGGGGGLPGQVSPLLLPRAGRLRVAIHPEQMDVVAVRVAAGERVT